MLHLYFVFTNVLVLEAEATGSGAVNDCIVNAMPRIATVAIPAVINFLSFMLINVLLTLLMSVIYT